MSKPLLDAAATSDRIRAIAEHAGFPPRVTERAFELSSRSPSPGAWGLFLSRAMLLLGALLVASGVIYFFAYNWAALHPFAKLGLLEAFVAASALASIKLGDRPSGQAALLMAALSVGALLGVYGQTYQTGADPYELFLGWALLITPWVLSARSPLLWALLPTLVQLSIALFFEQVVARERRDWVYLPVAAVGALVWGGWELAASRGVAWVKGRALPRWFAFVSLSTLLLPSSMLLVDSHVFDLGAEGASFAALLVALGLVLFTYRKPPGDLFMLAAAAGSIITLASCLIGRLLFDHSDRNPFLWLLFGLVIVGEVAAVAAWLRTMAAARDEEGG